MLLYVCKACHRWQDRTLADLLADAFANAAIALRQQSTATTPIPQDVLCPHGCGAMTRVQPGDKLCIVEEPGIASHAGTIVRIGPLPLMDVSVEWTQDAQKSEEQYGHQ